LTKKANRGKRHKNRKNKNGEPGFLQLAQDGMQWDLKQLSAFWESKGIEQSVIT
jgi:hypothetical protein